MMIARRLYLPACLTLALILTSCRGQPNVPTPAAAMTEVVTLTPADAAVTPVTASPTVEPANESGTTTEVSTATPTTDPFPTGGVVVEAGFARPTSFNPVLAADVAARAVNEMLYLSLLTADPFTGEVTGQIADSWTTSADGLTYTFSLRRDIRWTDGRPLTARDVKFTFDAVAEATLNSPFRNGLALVEQVAIIDEYTLRVTFEQLDCTALRGLTVGILPAHVYAADLSDVRENPQSQAPVVTSGPFKWMAQSQPAAVTLAANPDYYLGAPRLDGWVYRLFAAPEEALDAILAGEIDISEVEPAAVSVVEGAIADGNPLDITKIISDGYTLVGFNLANPENPQVGWLDLDENGLPDAGEPPLDQDPHPMFGETAVRQAVVRAIDYRAIINQSLYGEGIRAVSNVLPTVDWAFDQTLEPYPYDLAGAAAILEEAGWLEGGDGVRQKDGRRLSFHLMTNEDNEIHVNSAALIRDSLQKVGIEVELDILDSSAIVRQMLDQTYDAVIIGWTGLGADPEDSALWSYVNDVPGSGFNFVSYQNEVVEEALQAARSLIGCDVEARGEYYRQIQAEIYRDVPYAFLFVPFAHIVHSKRFQGLDPAPWSLYYNVEEWYLSDE